MQSVNDVPQELDWVKKRAACSLKQVFCELHRGVVEDVKDANESLQPKMPFDVVVSKLGEDFTVQRAESLRPTTSFVLLGQHIVISSSASKEQWKFTVGLNNDGRCQLRWDGQEYEQWQVRKMALESLFFGS